MNHLTYTWASKDGLSLFGQSWMPGGNPVAVINYVHGFKDHSSRFSTWATQLTREGYGVMAVDLRGHGRSDGRRGYAENFTCYLDDVRAMVQQSRRMYPAVPHILYGHSLGGNIVTNYLISQVELPAAAVITSPWFALAFKPSIFQRVMAGMLRYLLPGVTVKSNLDAAGLSHDPEVIADYISDPLVHNSILPKLFFQIEHAGIKAARSIYKINIPMLVMHGSADTITSVRQTRSFVQHASPKTTYREWPGCFHELHNDHSSEAVFATLVQWLQHLKLT
jgi:alpha-beta hydrolase superfamily lysophospholipase